VSIARATREGDPVLKQFAPACERNRDPILAVLREVLPPSGRVLEIGSGTGQHAAYFAPRLAPLVWQPSDLADQIAGIEAWRVDAGSANLLSPVVLDLFSESWPVDRADAVVCINTIHIVAWSGVERLLHGVGRILGPGGVFYAYGPYRYQDRPLEPSNVAFDQWLRERDPESGVREFEAVDALAQSNGLRLAGDLAMPANNRSIWWVKT